MERTNSVIRISRGRLAALLAATVLVSIALFSMIFYHWCLHAKQTEALTQGDGPLWAFEQGELEVVEEDPDGATVYGGAGYQVQVRDGFVTSVRDDNKGFTKLYEQGVLTSITFETPWARRWRCAPPSRWTATWNIPSALRRRPAPSGRAWTQKGPTPFGMRACAAGSWTTATWWWKPDSLFYDWKLKQPPGILAAVFFAFRAPRPRLRPAPGPPVKSPLDRCPGCPAPERTGTGRRGCRTWRPVP